MHTQPDIQETPVSQPPVIDDIALKVFRDMIPPRMVKLEKMLSAVVDQHDPEAMQGIGAIAHQFAGTAGSFGMEDLGAMSRDIEAGIESAKALMLSDTPSTAEFEKQVEAYLDALEEAYFV